MEKRLWIVLVSMILTAGMLLPGVDIKAAGNSTHAPVKKSVTVEIKVK